MTAGMDALTTVSSSLDNSPTRASATALMTVAVCLTWTWSTERQPCQHTAPAMAAHHRALPTIAHSSTPPSTPSTLAPGYSGFQPSLPLASVDFDDLTAFVQSSANQRRTAAALSCCSGKSSGRKVSSSMGC